MKNLMTCKGFFILCTFLALFLSVNYVSYIDTAIAEDNPLMFLDPSGEKMALMGEEVVFSVKAIKLGAPAAVLTYSATGLPGGAIFDTSTQVFSWKPVSDYDKKTYELKFTVSDGVNTAQDTIYLSVLTLSDTISLSTGEQDYWDNVRGAKGSPMTVSPLSLPALSDKTFLYKPAIDGDCVITEKLLASGNKALFLNDLATLQEFQITDGLSEPGNTAIIKNNIVYDDNALTGRQTYKLSFMLSPVIESVSLTGSTFIITGRHFGDTQGESYVLFDGLEADITAWSDTEISCIFPMTGESVGIIVVTEGGESNTVDFEVPTAYTLTIIATNGSVTKNPDQATYDNGDEVELTATPDAGYTFSSWSNGLTGANNPDTIIMDGDKVVAANFDPITYTITATAGAGGSIDPSGNVSVNSGANQSFAITANLHYNIQDVLVDGTSQGAIVSYTFTTVTDDHTISATFVLSTYTLTTDLNPTNGGSVTKNPDKATYNYGEVVALTASPAAGYSFSNWTGNLTGTINPANIIMNGPKTVTANFTRNNYTLTINATGGTVTKDPDQATYHYGDVVNLTASPAAGYSFSNWTGDITGTTTPASITINGNNTVTANFIQNIYYTLTVNVTPGNAGSVTKSPDQAEYASGTLVSLTFYENPGYMFIGWSGGGMTGSTYAKTINILMNGNKTITATFAAIPYTLNVYGNPGGVGCITKTPDQMSYHYGDVVQLNAVPDSTHAFTGWAGDLTGTTNPANITITGNMTIMANFSPIYTLTATADPTAGGSVAINPLKAYYVSGEQVTLTATTNPGYYFAGWGGDVMAGNTTFTITIAMYGNKTVTAYFFPYTHTITATLGTTGGTITPSGSVAVNQGSDQTFIMTPNQHYRIYEVQVDGVPVGTPSSYTFTNVITEGHTIRAFFIQNTYTLTMNLNPAAGGTYTMNPCKPTYTPNEQVTLTATPSPGYTFTGWSGDASGTDNPVTITMDSDKTVTASFTPIIYTITATAGANGTITPSVSITVNSGGSQTFSITPNAGYQVADVLVDGVSRGVISSYTFTNVTADHTISASFVQATYSLTINAVNGSVTKNPNRTSYTYGEVVTLTAKPYVNYSFVNWSGNLTGTTNPTTITMNGSKAVTANFTQTGYTITASVNTLQGTISPSGSVSVNKGANQTFTIAAVGSRYRIKDVVVDGVSRGAISTYTFNNVTADHTIYAYIEEIPITYYTITATAIGEYGSGTISPSGNITVQQGANQTFTITPGSGYFIIDIIVDGKAISRSYFNPRYPSPYAFYNVQANHTIQAIFQRNSYTYPVYSGSYTSSAPVSSTPITTSTSPTISSQPVTVTVPPKNVRK